MIHVEVMYFAVLREHRGTQQETLEIPVGTTAQTLYERLFTEAQRVPVAYAVNAERVSGDQRLADGDEVAFLPPLGGG